MALGLIEKIIRRFRQPRLRNLLFGMNLLVLLLPVAGIAVLRLYENELIRQTESELIAQGAFVVASYKVALSRHKITRTDKKIFLDYGLPLNLSVNKEFLWDHQAARLDLAQHVVLPAPSDAISVTNPPPDWIQETGRELNPILQEAQRFTLASIRVLDRYGVVVASTRGQLLASIAHWPEVAQALRGVTSSALHERSQHETLPPLSSISRGARLRVFVALPVVAENRLYGVVLLSRTPRNMAQALYEYRYTLGIVGAVLIFLVVVLTAFASLTITRPIAAVIEQARCVLRGDRNVKATVNHLVTYEMHQLSTAVNQMAQILAQRADYLRDFAAHVTHAFKSPLTAIQGSIELLQDHLVKMTVSERDRFLKNMHEDTQYLTKLVNSLLELARADTVEPHLACTSLLPVLAKCQEQYSPQGLSVLLDNFVSIDVQVLIDTTVLESILNSLLGNARQHGAKLMRITSRYNKDKSKIVLVFEDDGEGIPKENHLKIFEPFFTTLKGNGGTGLGLAVARSLLRAHHGDIYLVSGTPGATFAVELALN